MASRATELRIALAAFALLAVIFVAFPEIDLWASGLFYLGNGEWLFSPGKNFPLFNSLYWGIPRAGQALLLLLGVGLALGLLPFFKGMRTRRVVFGFLLAAAVTGPVLMVDATLKDYWGRARPATVEAFGGPKRFTPAFIPTRQCDKNCSFVSGHVATASFLMAFGWLGAPAIRRRWLVAGMASGALLAIVRLSAGGHFLSDCIFAWFASYFGLWITEWLFRRLGWLPGKNSGNRLP